MLQRICCLNNVPTELIRGDYVAVCIYQFSLSYLTRTSMRCPTNRTTALKQAAKGAEIKEESKFEAHS